MDMWGAGRRAEGKEGCMAGWIKKTARYSFLNAAGGIH